MYSSQNLLGLKVDSRFFVRSFRLEILAHAIIVLKIDDKVIGYIEDAAESLIHRRIHVLP